MFDREMRTKLPELRRETIDVAREEVRDRDWSNKLKGKAYMPMHVGVQPQSPYGLVILLLKADKYNKL